MQMVHSPARAAAKQLQASMHLLNMTSSLWKKHGSSEASSPPHVNTVSADCDPGFFTEQLDHPGGRIPCTHSLAFEGGPTAQRAPMPSYQTINGLGQPVTGANVPFPLGQELATRIYESMATLQVFDTLCYEAQRQGRFSFYLTSQGEEATVVASAAALDKDDMVFAQYREQGVLLWRGYSMEQFANQLYGNRLEPGHGRQMPIHYGSRAFAFHTISSPLATQMPHAVGAAYALKLQGSRSVTATFFGEGAASEGDAYAALNFAATLKVPCIFICRNNGYAISTPAREQYAGDGVAARGPALGIATTRVDGCDAQAVYNAVRQAREIASSECRPVLVEAMSYRSGHHSTSDDSSRYRTRDEMRAWRARDPVDRFRMWLMGQGWWGEGQEQQLRRRVRQQLMQALDAAAKVPKPPLSAMFTDVYAHMPPHLREQMGEALDLVRAHPEVCPPGVPVA